MPSLEEAREQAIQRRYVHRAHDGEEGIWREAWAEGEKHQRAEDERRIAALVAACEKIDDFAVMTHDEFGGAIGEMREALRALAGQAKALPAERTQERVE